MDKYTVHISLKTKDWKNHLEKEMALCINNNIPLLPITSNNNPVQSKPIHGKIQICFSSHSPITRFLYLQDTKEYVQKVAVSNLGAFPSRTDPKAPSRPPPPRSPATERKLLLVSTF